MKFSIVFIAIVVVVALRLAQRRRRHGAPGTAKPLSSSINSDVGLIVSREVRERFRGRIFRYGTLFILLVVAAAIIIPSLNSGKQKPQNVGVVGTLAPALSASVTSTAKSVGAIVHFVDEANLAAARADLRSCRITVAIVDARSLIVNKPLSPSDTSARAQMIRGVAQNLGIAEAFQAAQLSPTQSETLRTAKALPITSIVPGKSTTVHVTSIIGAVLIFIMLSQYNGWILMGVMEEKASRVIEVLLSAVRPIQLLTGKVIGIGLAALTQALAVVAFAIGVSKAVGSSFLSGTAPLVIMSTLVWLVLGYSFYCWLYAAAGSMVERQDQVQGLVLPLSLPMIFGYIMALTGASSGTPSMLLKVLAYIPPTAPFAMPVLVGFSAVTWWGFLASVMFSIICTVAVARFASTIYRRAILRTGGRVRFREVFARTSAH